MRKSLLILILISSFLFAGCSNADDYAVCEDPFPYSSLPPPGDSWWIFDFPNDYFPDEISLVIDSDNHPPDFETITAVMTNSATDPDYVIWYGYGFSLVRQIGVEWHRIPLYISFPDVMLSLSAGESHHFTIINDCYVEFYSMIGVMYTHGYRFTSVTYRIAALVGFPGWVGPIWAEFTITE